MLRYHHHLTKRAEEATAVGIIPALLAMQRDAALWTIPALLAVIICWTLQLSGTAALWVAIPLVAISFAGCVIYVGAVYVLAIKRHLNGS